MRWRFVLCAVGVATLDGLVVGMALRRDLFEPAIRAAYALMISRRVPYESGDYLLALSALAVVAVSSLAGMVYMIAAHRPTERRIDRFLASRRATGVRRSGSPPPRK